jgi:acetyl esterase/lipase
MNHLITIVLLLTLLTSCEKEATTDAIVQNTMAVQLSATYAVTVEQNVKYAEGLSHQTTNGPVFSTMDLKLDVYKPANNTKKKPAIVLIHGGSFISGDKSDADLANMATYFASRGLVAFSINYRLRSNKGTVPSEWIEYAQNNVPLANQAQFLAIYPAHRDAKAALRWLMANANQYNIDTNYITVGGNSAGAIIATTLGITNTSDFTNEISITTDPSLATTNLNSNNYTVKTIIDLWGSGLAVTSNNTIYNYNRFDPTDAPIMIAHGTIDQTVLYSEALALKNTYTTTGASYVLHTLENRGHEPWDATINGKSLEKLSFDFIVDKQNIIVE